MPTMTSMAAPSQTRAKRRIWREIRRFARTPGAAAGARGSDCIDTVNRHGGRPTSPGYGIPPRRPCLFWLRRAAVHRGERRVGDRHPFAEQRLDGLGVAADLALRRLGVA